MTEIAIWLLVVIIVGALLIGGIAGFFISRKVFQKMLEKNPPINENQIREMFRQMGRTPSEKQVRAVMQSMKNGK